MDGLIFTLITSMFFIFAVTIIITLVSLTRLVDERKQLIKMKAQSFSFMIVVFMLVIDIVKSIIMTFWLEESYEGISPVPYLFTISLVYLITLLVYKRKYGD